MTDTYITILRSKIHRATVTAVAADYEGSCLIDERLLDAANICEYEQIHIYNVSNGKRFITYAMKSKIRGLIQLNGAAAHKGSVGNTIIICTYHLCDSSQPIPHPIKVFVVDNLGAGDRNSVFRIG
ncbi:MAG: aspartate 1-decarboxylase [Nitrosopumilaceae archaeon]